jgi:NAD(P)-dependent dehydrogenase (short-subunit alcohol dehydrogenase family)
MDTSKLGSSSLHGKTIIITGAGSGIGLETALGLASKGAALVIVDVDRGRGESAIERIERNGPSPRLFLADLSVQAEVRRVAGEILAATPRIEVLINNAGAMFMTRHETVDGLERTLALNHLGYFLLTNLLLDRIIASAPARIVSVSSRAHRFEALDFDDLQKKQNYSGQAAYFRSKLANVLFTRALAKRLCGTGVTANAAEPGWGMVLTNFFHSAGWETAPEHVARATTAAEGAKTSIYLASSSEVDGVNGQYFADCQAIAPADAALDEAAAERLWAESVQLCGLTPERAFGSEGGHLYRY